MLCVGTLAASVHARDLHRPAVELDGQGRLVRYISSRHVMAPLQPVAVRLVETTIRKGTASYETFVDRVPPKIRGTLVEHAADHIELEWVEQIGLRDGHDLEWSTTLRNRTDLLREFMLEFVFTLDGTDTNTFFPSAVPHPPWPETGALRYGHYRWDEGVQTAIPMGSLYSTGRDVGITFCAELKGHIEPISIEMRRESPTRVQIVVRRRYLRLNPRQSKTSTFHITLHAGDWRAALGWVRTRWHDLFHVGPAAEPFQLLGFGGCMPALNIEREMPYCLDVQINPWYGDYWPDRDRWTPNIQGYLWNMKRAKMDVSFAQDANPQAIEAWFHKHGVPDEAYPDSDKGLTLDFSYEPRPYQYSKAFARRYLNYVHEYGMKAMLYFCPTEAWGPYMKHVYPRSLVRGPQKFFPPTPWPNGKLEPQYYNWDSYTTNPDPDLPYGRSLLDQVERLYTELPDIDGIYIDQPFHCELDAGNDDGISILNGRAVANTSYSFDQLMREIRRMTHQRGKIVYCNIPVRIGEARWTDLMLQESRGPLSFVRQQYLTIGNRLSMALFPFTATTTFEGAEHPEGLTHTALEAGFLGRANTTWKAWHNDLDDLVAGRRYLAFCYRPLFAALRGRSWVLEPHCLDLPEGTRGNLFRTKGLNFLCPVILPGTSIETTSSVLDLAVTIRIPHAEAVRAAYFTSPDHVGLKHIHFQRQGEAIHLTIPRQRSVSMILLATSGRFAALASTRVERNQPQIDLVLDNWTPRPWRYVGTATGFAHGAIEVEVQPWSRRTISLDCDWSRNRVAKPDRRAFFVTTPSPSDWPEIRLAQDPNIDIFECFVDEGIQIDFAPQRNLAVAEPAEVMVTITNHTESVQILSPKITLDGATINDAPTSVRIEPGTRQQFALGVTPTLPGPHTLTVQTGPARCSRPLVVDRRTLVADTDLAQIVSAWVQLDSFAQDMAGPKPWRLKVNGSHAVDIPPDSGSWVGGWRSEVGRPGRFPLKPEAVAVLSRSNMLVLSNPNRDAPPFNTRYGFKIRHVQLGLRFNDGTEIICPANEQHAVTSCDPDWRYAEGRCIPLEDDMVWQLAIPAPGE